MLSQGHLPVSSLNVGFLLFVVVSVEQSGTMSKLSKFEIELPAAPKSSKLSLSERDIAMATMYVSD